MKNVLVTGVTRGMGEATAKLLVNEGYFIYGVYNSNKAEAEKLKKELKNIEVFQCDFSKEENVKNLIKKLSETKFAGIVNSAGVFMSTNFEEFDTQNWRKTFEIDLIAPLLLVQGLRNNIEDGGSIVNISSTDAMVGAVSGMAYSASKAALINLTQSFTNLFAKRKIRANAIAPGWIGDGMKSPDELLKEAATLNPLKRNGTYEEIAQVVAFLISEKSSYVNGTTITVDGGSSATSYILQKEAEIIP